MGHREQKIQPRREAKREGKSQGKSYACTRLSTTSPEGSSVAKVTGVLMVVNTGSFLLLDHLSNSRTEGLGEQVHILICTCSSHNVLTKCSLSPPLRVHKSVLL